MKLATLDRKLLRDLWLAKGQAIAIAMVVAAGVALFVLLRTTIASLELTESAYYDRYRFGNVFVSCKRAPLRVAERIRQIPGVARADARVVEHVTLDVPGLAEPAAARMISLPVPDRPTLDDVVLRAGRYPELGRSDEVLVSEAFANANHLAPGDTLAAVVNGRWRRLRIAGLALSPEFVYTIRPGELLPDDRRYAIIWMERRALATAFDMEGAFNDVVIRLMRGASSAAVIDRVDALLNQWGGLGAIPRQLQASNFYLSSELGGLRAFGAVLPVIFLAVAAFLVNVVLSRMVDVQREQIAAIKALGYSNRAVGLHFVKWAVLVSGIGATLGVGVGAWLGRSMTEMYTAFFRFPLLQYHLAGRIVLAAVAVSLASAVVGALAAVRRAVTLPPAEAMRPEPPTRYRSSLAERLGLMRWLSQPTRIVLRNLERHPGRAALSVVGIAFGAALYIAGSFSIDAMDAMMDVQFNISQRWDLAISFAEPRSAGALDAARHLPGALRAEPYRAVPVRFVLGHRRRTSGITGIARGSELYRLVDVHSRPVSLPQGGLVLSTELAKLIGAKLGDLVTVEVLEGARPIRRVPVTLLVEESIGAGAYMDLEALHRLMRESDVLSGVYLQVDSRAEPALFHRLKTLPVVSGVSLRSAALASFNETLGTMIGAIRTINIVFAVVIAFGVVYNAARIALAERSRELATLRVIGFERAEIAYILLGELALLTVLAVPLGLVIGHGLAAAVARLYDTEMWRLPLVISSQTYALAAIVVVAATAVSSLVVRRKLDHLDLIEVLKTRE